MKDIIVTINEPIWKNRADKYNAEKKAQHDATQASKKPEERTEYVPVTVEEYALARIADIETSYARQIEEETLAEVRADPVQYGRLIKALTNPELREQLSAQIDAM